MSLLLPAVVAHRMLSCVEYRRIALLSILAGGVALGCSADDPPPSFGSHDLLLKVTVASDGVQGVEAVGLIPPGSLARLAPGQDGALEVLAVDPDRRVQLGDGRIHFQRFVTLETFHEIGIEGVEVEVPAADRYFVVRSPASDVLRVTFRLEGETRAYEIDLEGAAAAGPIEGTEVAPVDEDASAVGMLRAATSHDAGGGGDELVSDETCGDGTVDEHEGGGLFSFFLRLFDEQCDDGNTEDGDGCSSHCRNELVHVGGSTDVNNTYAVVFVPTGWGDLAAFEAYTRGVAESLLAQDWYDEHADGFSFWALAKEEVDELGEVACAGPMDTPSGEDAAGVNARIDQAARPEALLAMYEGALGVPTVYVITHPQECRSWTTFGGSAISLGRKDQNLGGVVMAHEIGHNLGYLADEYDYGSCRGANTPNLSETPEVKWSCLLENNGGAACPDGGAVRAFSVEAGCDPQIVRPCTRCMMRDYADFCPICRAQMDSRFAGGGDVDLGGCDCTPNDCPATGCGGDGCFGECGCGAGERCFAGMCEAGCVGNTCGIDALGREVCDGDIYLHAGDCPDGQARRCTCDAANWTLTDCGDCIGM